MGENSVSGRGQGRPWMLPVRCVIFPAVFVAAALILSRSLSSLSNRWSVLATIVNVFTIVLLVYVARRDGQTYGELINYHRGATRAGRTAAVVGLMVLIAGAGMMIAGLLCYGKLPYAAPMMIEPVDKRLAIANVLFLPVTTALAEDGLYLGYGVNRLNGRAAVLVPAFFYSLQHCFIPTLPEAEFIIYRFLCFLPLALMVCAMYRKDRNPVPIMIGHALLDLATAVQIVATSVDPSIYSKMCEM